MELKYSQFMIKGWSTTGYSHYKTGLNGGLHHTFEQADNSVWLAQTKETGKKTSTLWVKLDRRDFGEIACLMLSADRSSAIRAFAEALIATEPNDPATTGLG